MNHPSPNPSKPMLYSGLLFFIGIAVAAFIYFYQSITDLLQALTSLPGVVSFDKGAFYMPGVFLGLAVLIFAAIYESVLRKEATKRYASICTKTGIAAVVIMFLLPMIVHNRVEDYLLQKNYSICNEASHQWLHARTIVYVISPNECKQLLNKNGLRD